MSKKKIRIKEQTVFDGNKGWLHNSVKYSLCVSGKLALTPNGDILCSWLSGATKEPFSDNCILISISTDNGISWSEPRIWIPADEMAGGGHIMQYPNKYGNMIGFGANWPSEKKYTEWHYYRTESFNNGYSWKKQNKVIIHKENNVSIAFPIMISGEEYLFPATVFRKRNKFFKGSVEKLAFAKSEEEALLIPREEGKYNGGEFSDYHHYCSVFKTDKNMEKFTELGSVSNRPLGLLEPTIIQLKNGNLVMYMRAEWGGFLWRADSSDGGYNWTKAYQTDIPNPSSLPFIIRLPDERIALLHNNSGGEVGKKAKRNKLSIWISDDELESWSIKEDVIEGGSLSYPNAIILEDGKLVFGYDYNRIEVRFVEVYL